MTMNDGDENAVRERILDAAFAAFRENGYAATSTLEIATRARVSKRELYSVVGNKQEMLICVYQRERQAISGARRVTCGARSGDPRAQILTSCGARLVSEISDPAVIAVFRLAIAEAVNAPEVAQALDSIGREASRAALRQIMAQALASGLLSGRPADLAEQFGGLLWGTLMVSLLLGVAERPGKREVLARARDAATAFLQLHVINQ